MHNLPSPEVMRKHVIKSLSIYWPVGKEYLESIEVSLADIRCTKSESKFVEIKLPTWAHECGVNGKILVPSEAVLGPGSWQNVDWWLAAFMMLEAWHERNHEACNGPIHSYSVWLNTVDPKIWRHAWVNRIALFLRMYAAINYGKDEASMFGDRPRANILLTHDVDAIDKTMVITFKQIAFNIIKIFKNIYQLRFKNLVKNYKNIYKFLAIKSEWWFLDEMLEAEKKLGIVARFHVHTNHSDKPNLKLLLTDPSYDPTDKRLIQFVSKIDDPEFSIGIHPGYDCWQDAKKLKNKTIHLQNIFGHAISSCRQHWLRFSWEKTWHAQSLAGIVEDTTLMFNDRPGFRNSSAIRWKPWCPISQSSIDINATPTVFMDSHFYDYNELTDKERKLDMVAWIQECLDVGGQIAVLWHPQTLSEEYGWSEGFHELLLILQEAKTGSQKL
ncbi:hypothetical protein pfor_22c2442 [Rhodobacteraceae bacterium SB2]|nr:hypothetical protein pfor_22c2442 [Rhodobacteraceae bacterium SB2]